LGLGWGLALGAVVAPVVHSQGLAGALGGVGAVAETWEVDDPMHGPTRKTRGGPEVDYHNCTAVGIGALIDHVRRLGFDGLHIPTVSHLAS